MGRELDTAAENNGPEAAEDKTPTVPQEPDDGGGGDASEGRGEPAPPSAESENKVEEIDEVHEAPAAAGQSEMEETLPTAGAPDDAASTGPGLDAEARCRDRMGGASSAPVAEDGLACDDALMRLVEGLRAEFADGFAALHQKLDDLGAKVDDRLRDAGRASSSALDHLHEELVRYRDRSLFQDVTYPALRPAIDVYHGIERLKASLLEQPPDQEGSTGDRAQFVSALEVLMSEIQGDLQMHGVGLIEEGREDGLDSAGETDTESAPAGRFDARIHNVIQTEITNEKADHGRIVRLLRSGFSRDGKVLCKSQVVAKRYVEGAPKE